MNRIKNLEIKRLLKELDFIEMDYEYRTELISEADSEFMKSINLFLDKNPELKQIYDEHVTSKLDNTIKEGNVKIVNDSSVSENSQKSTEVKKIYREIVKLTHPDRINNDNLQDIYIRSTKLYDNNDKIGLYKICQELGIDVIINDEDKLNIEQKIENLKNKINFIETTFTWKWFNTEDEKEKQKVILDFLTLKLT